MLTLKEYMYIQSIPTGSTYESELIKYLGIDQTLTYNEIQEEVADRLAISDYTLKDKFYLHDKWWKYETDFLESTYEQWAKLESLLSDETNRQNLHKILAIYCRPATMKRFSRKFFISKFDLGKQDGIAEELLDLPMSIEKELIRTFFLLAIKSLNYTKIHCLNLLNKQ